MFYWIITPCLCLMHSKIFNLSNSTIGNLSKEEISNIIKEYIIHNYLQIDGTIVIPNSVEGDLIKYIYAYFFYMDSHMI